MWAQQRHGDENYFDERGTPTWCEYVSPLHESVDDALALPPGCSPPVGVPGEPHRVVCRHLLQPLAFEFATFHGVPEHVPPHAGLRILEFNRQIALRLNGVKGQVAFADAAEIRNGRVRVPVEDDDDRPPLARR